MLPERAGPLPAPCRSPPGANRSRPKMSGPARRPGGVHTFTARARPDPRTRMRGLSEHQLLLFLIQFALLLAAARLLGGIARRLGQPSVMGEVIAGVLLGPT